MQVVNNVKINDYRYCFLFYIYIFIYILYFIFLFYNFFTNNSDIELFLFRSKDPFALKGQSNEIFASSFFHN